MGRDVVDREADELGVALVELRLGLGEGTELGGAHRGEVLGVREDHAPAVAQPLVKIDRANRGLCGEVRGNIVDAERHRIFLVERIWFRGPCDWGRSEEVH